MRTAGGGVIAVVAASATRRSGVIAALPLRAGGGVLLRGLAPALLDDFCMLQQLNAATKNKSCLYACELSLSNSTASTSLLHYKSSSALINSSRADA